MKPGDRVFDPLYRSHVLIVRKILEDDLVEVELEYGGDVTTKPQALLLPVPDLRKGDKVIKSGKPGTQLTVDEILKGELSGFVDCTYIDHHTRTKQTTRVSIGYLERVPGPPARPPIRELLSDAETCMLRIHDRYLMAGAGDRYRLAARLVQDVRELIQLQEEADDELPKK